VLESCSNPQKTWQVFDSADKKQFFVLGFRFYVGDIISEVDIWPFWLRLPGPWAQPLDGSISPKFLLETRLESKFFSVTDSKVIT